MQHRRGDHLSSTSINDEAASMSRTELLERANQPTETMGQTSRLTALRRSWVHVLPLSITLTMLAFNFSNKYWTDLGAPHQNVILQAFQFLAKGHEMSMGLSLSTIVLHRIRYGLSLSGGIPLGLLPAGYQLSSIGYLLEAGFRGGVRTKPTLCWLPLGAFISWAFILSTVVGPSSAIVLIPRLDFWDLPKSLFNTPDQKMNPAYILNTQSELWPQQLSADNVISACQGPLHASFKGCPDSGYDTVIDWINGHVDQDLPANISITDNNMSRWLTTSPSMENSGDDSGWTITSTVGAREAEAIANYWEYIGIYNPNVAGLGRSTLAPSLDDGVALKKPAVQVQCSAYYDADSISTVQFPHSHLHSPPIDDYEDEDWEFAVNFSSNIHDAQGLDPEFSGTYQGQNISDVVFFQFVDLSNITSATVLGALSVFPTRNGSTVIIPCTLDAHWAPVSIYIDPSSSANIYQDTPDPSVLVAQDTANYSETQMIRINIGKSWADMLDRPAQTLDLTYTSAIRALIRGYGGQYQSNSSATPRFLISGSQISNQTEISTNDQSTIPWRISTILGMYMTEALVGIHQADANLVYHNNLNDPYVLQLSALYEGHYNWTGSPNGSVFFDDYDRSFQDYLDSINHIKLNWNTQRYGYGWGFRGTPVLIATLVLLTQALMALVHTLVTVSNGWTSDRWGTMGEMLLLALNSMPTARSTKSTPAGSEIWTRRDVRSWKDVVRVREVEDYDTRNGAKEDTNMQLELVLEG